MTTNKLAKPNRMVAGEILQPQLDRKNHGVISPKGQRQFLFQTDGNLVLYGPTYKPVYFASNTNRSGISRLMMQGDGNLVIYGNDSKPKWASDTQGHPGAYLEVTELDAAILGPNGTPTLWSAVSDGKNHVDRRKGDYNIDTWISNAAKTAGRAAGSAARAVDSVTGAIDKEIKKIPIVGGVLAAVVELGDMPFTEPFKVSAEIVAGDRIDRAVLNHFKQELADIKEVGPYAEMVIAFVPGIGPAVSGAIAAGLAIAEGQPLDKIAEAAIRGAIPGGAIAVAVYEVGKAAVQGKIDFKNISSLEHVVAGALPIPDVAKTALNTALDITQKLASGAKLGQAVIDGALAELPANIQGYAKVAVNAAVAAVKGEKPEKILLHAGEALADEVVKHLPIPDAAKKAIGIGIAVAHGQNLQTTIKQALPVIVGVMNDSGIKIAAVDSVVAAARNLVADGKKGFDTAIGAMHVQTGITALKDIRATFTGPDLKAFDMGVSLHIGRVSSSPPPVALTPEAKAGYFAVHGLQTADPVQKSTLVDHVIAQPEAKLGATVAAQAIIAKKNTPWWHPVVRVLTLGIWSPKV